ncbi:hypothetical protein RRG08_022303 [Elysia crispata]|uniref:Uncharacterized protein n=1 Tax=Elysia crispata TaxID=231223 RepID=A0AAE1DK20_9GAST|nr:hypothetical protein RRG08_022303 [Elysia crispata]
MDKHQLRVAGCSPGVKMALDAGYKHVLQVISVPDFLDECQFVQLPVSSMQKVKFCQSKTPTNIVSLEALQREPQGNTSHPLQYQSLPSIFITRLRDYKLIRTETNILDCSGAQCIGHGLSYDLEKSRS